jgi:hypothetical protein
MTPISNFTKTRPVGAKMVCADGEMARHDRANGHFSRVISGFCHEVDENCTLVGYYAASSGNFHINNQRDALSIQNFYFVMKLYMFWASSVPIIRSYQLYTWQLVCFVQVMWPLPLELQPDSPTQWPHNLHETYQLPCLQLITPDDGHRRCPKHVDFCDKIKILNTLRTWLVIYMKIITMHGHLNIKYSGPSKVKRFDSRTT